MPRRSPTTSKEVRRLAADGLAARNGVRVGDVMSLAVVFSSMVVDNDYQRNCDDLKTTRDGLAGHGNVKEMRVAVSNEI